MLGTFVPFSQFTIVGCLKPKALASSVLFKPLSSLNSFIVLANISINILCNYWLPMYLLATLQCFYGTIEKLILIKDLAMQIIKTVDGMNYNPMPISELGLSSRAMNCLKWQDIDYVEQLFKLNQDEILRFRGMGKITFDEINEKVKFIGLRGWD